MPLTKGVSLRGAFLAAALLSVFTCFAGCGTSTITSSGSPISIVSVDGKAAKSGKAVSKGDEVMPGETVLVEEGSAAVVKISNKAAVTLKNASKLVFDEVTDTAISLNLDYGAMMTVVAPSERKFILKTPAAVAGVRGTAFYVEARAIDQTYICLCEGILSLTMPDTVQEMQTPNRSRHNAFLISPDPSGALRPSRATMLNHTNADIAALENVVRRK